MGAVFRWVKFIYEWCRDFGLLLCGVADNPGLSYFVDGTNGNNANSGKDWNHAFATIQKAIDTQIANTSGLGDTIYIAPGNYVEELTWVGALTRCSLIGIPGKYPWHIVSVRPEDSYALHGELFETLIKNICFLSPSVSNKDYPPVQLTEARYSIIEDCHFVGATNTPSETGLQIGNRDAEPTVAHFDYCIVRHNKFDTWFGTASEFTHGIKVGRVDYDAGSSKKQMVGTIIENNYIWAKDFGIYIGVYCADFSVIRYNVIDSAQNAEGKGVADTGIEFYGGFPMIVKNWINALTDAINCTAAGALPGRVLDNWVGEAGAAVIEGPAMV